MQILLSCSKDMRSEYPCDAPRLSSPLFQTQADEIARQMNRLGVDDFSNFLALNAQLSALNKLRYHRFFDEGGRHAAALAYSGMAYRHLEATSWTADDFEEAQRHLWHTSFLYGLLRPMDGIKDYRLEGKVKLPDFEGRNLFQYWREWLTDALIDSTKADDGVLINLASAEMKQLFDWKRVERNLRVITADFLVSKLDGRGEEKLRNVVVYTKMLRGATARHIIVQRLRQPEELRGFAYEGFEFCPEQSNEQRYVWVLR